MTNYGMTITCTFLRINDKLLYNGIIKYFNKPIGVYNFSINQKNMTLNNIEIDEEYRRKGYGTYVLKEIEKFSKQKYNVNKTNLLAWDINGSSSIFFKKNAYINVTKKEEKYDDYVYIYDLIQFEKMI